MNEKNVARQGSESMMSPLLQLVTRRRPFRLISHEHILPWTRMLAVEAH